MNIFDKRPLSLILCILLGGFVFFSLGEAVVRVILILCALVLFGASIYLYARKCGKVIILASAISLTVGILFSHIYFSLIFDTFDKYDGHSEVVADIESRDPGTYTTSFVLNVKSINGDKISGRKVLLTLYDSDIGSMDIGDTISFTGEFETIKSTNDFDAQSYYYSKGISARIFDAENLEIIGHSALTLEYFRCGYRQPAFCADTG